MLTVIDDLTVVTGWSGPAGATFVQNAVLDYIANNLASSLIIYIPPNSLGQLFQKTVSVSFAGASSITLAIWSRQCRKTSQNKPADYFYKIDFGGGNVFMLPTPLAFENVDFGLNGWSAATKIGIIPTTNNEDWIIISGCYAVTDEYPLDVFEGVKAGIRLALAAIAPPYIVGTFSCLAGAPSISLPVSPPYLDRYAVLQLTDGVNTELHQVERYDETSVWFTGQYDGAIIVHAFTLATASLYFPVETGVLEKEAAIPGIAIWGFEAMPNQDESDVFQIEDTFTPSGGAATRKNVFMQNYRIAIDCEARSSQVLALLSRAVRWWIGTQKVWINGRKNDIGYEDNMRYIEPPEGTLQIPKVQFEIEIEVHEERDLRTFLPAFTGGGTITYSPKQGPLLVGHTGGNNDV